MIEQQFFLHGASFPAVFQKTLTLKLLAEKLIILICSVLLFLYLFIWKLKCTRNRKFPDLCPKQNVMQFQKNYKEFSALDSFAQWVESRPLDQRVLS